MMIQRPRTHGDGDQLGDEYADQQPVDAGQSLSAGLVQNNTVRTSTTMLVCSSLEKNEFSMYDPPLRGLRNRLWRASASKDCLELWLAWLARVPRTVHGGFLH